MTTPPPSDPRVGAVIAATGISRAAATALVTRLVEHGFQLGYIDTDQAAHRDAVLTRVFDAADAWSQVPAGSPEERDRAYTLEETLEQARWALEPCSACGRITCQGGCLERAAVTDTAACPVCHLVFGGSFNGAYRVVHLPDGAHTFVPAGGKESEPPHHGHLLGAEVYCRDCDADLTTEVLTAWGWRPTTEEPTT